MTNAGSIIGGSCYSPREVPFQAGAGVDLSNDSVLVNSAYIAGGAGGIGNTQGGPGGEGVYLTFGGTITNDAGATITGGVGSSGGDAAGGGAGGVGVNLAGKTVSSGGITHVTGGTLTNAGTILGGAGGYSGHAGGGGAGGVGLSLGAGGYVTNSGSIGGGLAGSSYYGGNGGAGEWIQSSNTGSALINSGIMTGGNGNNVVADGTEVVRVASNTFSGGAGVIVGSHGTLTNSGTIVGGDGVYVGAGGAFTTPTDVTGGDGVGVASDGTVINSGIIISGVGVSLADGGTLTTSATISGGMYGGATADAVLFAGAGMLVVEPTASFVGAVVGSGSALDVLDLAAGSGAGTLGGIGTQFVNFAQITIGAGAHWTLTGANTIASGATLTELAGASLTDTSTLLNDGSILLDPSTMLVAGLTGTGSVAIDAGSSLEVQGTISSGETIAFGGSGAYLHLDAPDSVSGSITNFAAGETIDLKGIDPSTVTYASGQLLFSGGGDIPLALANGGMVFASASSDGAEVTVLLCFCANTLILTPSGERPVQDLAVGDLVTTHRGEVRPIEWIGNGKVLATRGKRNAATPVIVRKNALADNVPHRDLRVTKAHALWFDGVLIPVEYLVNHRLIEWDDRAQEVELYHIELASHDVLVANGAPAESYRDDGNRWLFRNANSGWDLPPQPPCAPVLTGGPVVDAVWRRLLERTGPCPGLPLTDDPDLHLLVDGARLDAGGRHGTAYVFDLPARAGSVRIVSRAGVPAELGLARDPRLLGVALRQIVLRQGVRFRVIEAADAALAEGFHPFEPVNGLRWTDGDAVLPAALYDGFAGAWELVLHIGGTTRYPLLGETERRAAA